MAKRKDSFSRALADANKRLEQAQVQRQSTREILARLELEIPALQRTIAALRQQLNPNTVTLEVKKELRQDNEFLEIADTVLNNAPDDALLPDVDGTPLIPEE